MKAPAPPRVVASVLNWNTPGLTLQCLDSLEALDDPALRVIVVDNASDDDSVARVRAAHPALTLLRSPLNVGYALGHARALAEARACGADAIWLLNSDVQVETGALRALHHAWRQHGNAIYGGAPLRRRPDGSAELNFPQKYLDPQGAPRALRRDREVDFDAAWRARAPLRVGAVPGSCFFLPMALVERHGWMDPDWFLYCEEIDYCYRLRRAGVPSVLVPGARVWHDAGGSLRGRPGVADCIAYYRARNEILLAQRHAGAGTFVTTAAKKAARGLLESVRAPGRGRRTLQGVRDALCGRRGKTLAPEDFLGT